MWPILKKEILTNVRNRRSLIIGALLLVLMLVAVTVGWQGQKKIRAERIEAQHAMYDKWVNQGEKHPHSAAHYGQFAFKPKSTLGFLDVGVDNYTGTSVFLEAHKQNEILYSAAQDSEGISRFGELNVAFILQLLFPLMIIFIAHDVYSKEREDGTLKLIIASGISASKVFWSKVCGIYVTVLLIFLPSLLLAYFLLGQEDLPGQSSTNFFAFVSVYAIYFFIFVGLSVLISAFSRNSSLSLLSLIGIWIVACIIVPKATANLADKISPAPSQYEFRKTIDNLVKSGIDGHNPRDERLASLKQQVFSQYGVTSIEELPVNWSGIAMQAGEEYTDKVYDMEFSKVENIFKQQNRLSEWVGFIDPYLAIRNLSMALSGTDFHHHIVFARAAEQYRRDFVKKMNKDMEINHKPGVAYRDYSVGKEMWSSIDSFSYESPSISKTLSAQKSSVSSLLLWVAALFLFVTFFAKKIKTL